MVKLADYIAGLDYIQGVRERSLREERLGREVGEKVKKLVRLGEVIQAGSLVRLVRLG